METGIILDTDIGYDPDDMFALLELINNSKVDLIVTSDDPEGKRFIFLKKILELTNKEIEVVQGSTLNKQHFIVDEFITGENYKIKNNYIKRIKNIVDDYNQINYIGIGPFTNLSRFIGRYPNCKNKITLYQMGGSINYSRRPNWVEHNVKIDVKSAINLINSGIRTYLVGAQTTFNNKIQIDPNTDFYKKLERDSNSLLKILRKHIDIYHKHSKSWPYMHDPLTVSVALGEKFVKFKRRKIVVEIDGNLKESQNGSLVSTSLPKSNTLAFMKYLNKSVFM